MIKRIIDFVVQLQFLSGSARQVIFGTGTRVWEFFSLSVAFSLGALLLIDDGAMFVRFDVYQAFLRYGRGYADEALACLLLLCGVCISAGLAASHSYRAVCLGRWGMSGLGLIWALVAAGFWHAAPWSMAVVVYALMALFCWFVGEHLGDVAEALEKREAACSSSTRT